MGARDGEGLAWFPEPIRRCSTKQERALALSRLSGCAHQRVVACVQARAAHLLQPLWACCADEQHVFCVASPLAAFQTACVPKHRGRRTPSCLCAKRKALPQPLVCFLRWNVPDGQRDAPCSPSSLPRFQVLVGGKAPLHLACLCPITQISSASRQESGVCCSPPVFSVGPFDSLCGDRKRLPHLTSHLQTED